MNDKKKQRVIKSRDEGYTEKSATRICQEIPALDNPYVCENIRFYGYDLLELMQKRSLADVIFLLTKGELPTKSEAMMFEALFIAFINPGPRHAGTRAAMNAAVGKTDPAHILPIGLLVLGGSYLGGTEVGLSMEFLKSHRKENPKDVALKLLASANKCPKEGDCHIAPGFGSRFGSIDRMANNIAENLITLDLESDYLRWAREFTQVINEKEFGWLITGVAAAGFLDLGFHPRVGVGLFQLMGAPGMLAHGMELANKPRTAMPFLDDKNYHIVSD